VGDDTPNEHEVVCTVAEQMGDVVRMTITMGYVKLAKDLSGTIGDPFPAAEEPTGPTIGPQRRLKTSGSDSRSGF
jgi:hypothetical protein